MIITKVFADDSGGRKRNLITLYENGVRFTQFYFKTSTENAYPDKLYCSAIVMLPNLEIQFHHNNFNNQILFFSSYKYCSFCLTEIR